MQVQKISFKFFTSRELINFKRLYYSREFASTVNSNNKVCQINNTCLIYGTMCTLSSKKRIHFRKQLIKIDTINKQSITFILFPILVSQSVINFSQLSKIRFYLKGTSYLLKISSENSSEDKIVFFENQQKILNQANFILNKFQDFQFDNNESINFIPSFILLPTLTGTKTPRLYINIKNCIMQNKEPINKLIRLQIYYLRNVLFTIFFIIKLNFLLNSIKG